MRIPSSKIRSAKKKNGEKEKVDDLKSKPIGIRSNELVYKSEMQSDTSKEFNVDMKKNVIKEENDCNVVDDKFNVGICSSGIIGTSDDNASIDTSGGTRDVGDELAVDSANVSGTINLNSSADTLVYSKRFFL
ncbi:conserved hypothetical protein [Ricinus communis]|uniref:Uncharacterized protein n=1 Tax=Ricinus communis TaxID=3988 RepID=B9S086_RICCO|nr:conserved hypothetical protein [Ricinus communis]